MGVNKNKKPFNDAERQMIEDEFQRLLDDYSRTNHRQRVELIRHAFEFANAAHDGVRRLSGEPYMMHPLAVARIVVREIGLGSTSICAALMHDVVEDTEYTTDDIRNLFGDKIAMIVDGLTKISGGVFGDKASEQAENFRKLLLTMSDDIRVVLIKIADRLHNMRTLGAQPKEKQYKIAGETLYIYAPLAHRLGLFPIKSELEDLSFHYEHPDKYDEIEHKIEQMKQAHLESFEHFAEPIRKKMQSMGYEFTLTARIKSVYSVWRKMTEKHVAFEDIYDLLAMRIVFTPQDSYSEKDQCWMIYSAITEIYRPHPERIRDWISMPKSNGYEALHITVMAPDGEWIEVQIRTNRMNEIAERGLAAHWKYKVGHNDESELDKWLREIKDILANPEPNAMDFLGNFKLNLFAQEVFVFTPGGEIITMPQGATVLDLAFHLHTDLGVHCIGAKVDHELKSLDYVLQSGNQVEILISDDQHPHISWLDYVVTAKAQRKLRQYFGRRERDLQQVVKKKSIWKRIIPFVKSEKEEAEFQLCPCCRPIPGDEVMGYQREDGKMEIHSLDCKQAQVLKSSHGKQIKTVKWESKQDKCYPSTIDIKGIDQVGILTQIIPILSEVHQISITSIHADANAGIFNAEIGVMVHDTNEMDDIINAVKHIKGVEQVNRIR